MDDPNLEEYNPELLKCIKRVPRTPGCTAAYFFPKDVDLCAALKKDNSHAGNLVINVRSGDIFTDAVLSYYGQVCILYTDRKNVICEIFAWPSRPRDRGVSHCGNAARVRRHRFRNCTLYFTYMVGPVTFSPGAQPPLPLILGQKRCLPLF